MASSAARQSKRAPFDLHQAFARKEEGLLNELRAGKEVAGHSGVQGQGTETQWRGMLEGVLPARYQVSAAIVVDSDGGQSDQIDIVIRDGHFSPLFWESGGHLYVPAESVYAVFEVKPEMTRKYLLYASQKVASVRKLRRTSAAFGWARGVMDARELPAILGGFLADESEWSHTFGDPFRRAITAPEVEGQIDMGCVLGHGAFEVPRGASPDAIEVSTPDTALVSFMLRLLKRLQGLGSAPAIDYGAYARWINSRAVPGAIDT